MFTKSAFSMAALRLAMAPHAGIATFFGMRPSNSLPPRRLHSRPPGPMLIGFARAFQDGYTVAISLARVLVNVGESSMSAQDAIQIVGARQHNLKNISVRIPHRALTVVTGLSGSGKSSLAFDTLYAEGERKYVESLSAYSRQFLEQMPKPDVDRIDNLCPTVAIQQRAALTNPRSTVATTTEIYDYLRVLFARVGRPGCWICGEPISKHTIAQMVDAVLDRPDGWRVVLLAPLSVGDYDSPAHLLETVARHGFVRIRVKGTICAIEDAPALPHRKKTRVDVVVDRLVVKKTVAPRLADSLELALKLSGGRVIASVGPDGKRLTDLLFSQNYACPRHPEVNWAEISPRMFSFNSPYGACQDCDGLGTILEFDPDLIVPDRDLSLQGGAVAAWPQGTKRTVTSYQATLSRFSESFQVSLEIPFRNIPDDLARILLHGTTGADAKKCGHRFEGVIPSLKRRWEATDSEAVKQRLHRFLSEAPCRKCKGDRLRPEALAVTIESKSIAEMCAMDIAQARCFFDRLTFKGQQRTIAEQPLREIRHRLKFLDDVGVHYLSLSRSSATLSGGEAQRIRLATQIGSGLIGVCYVLDEPTIGLHQRDSRQLVATLKRLSGSGSTVVVVEHDEEVIASADHVIDVGPGAGAHGGEVIVDGTLADLLASRESATANYLTGRLSIPVPEERREIVWSNGVEIRGARANNLKNLDVRFPLGRFVCVTGVSGSGKSTLVTQILLRALQRRINGTGPRPGLHDRIIGAARVDRVIQIDQSPIGRTPRSNPATYVGVFDLVRQLYAKTRGAKIRGFGPGRFSFNVKGGRCEECQGQGTRRIEMHFLPDVFVECDACKGSRYNRETLDTTYRGKNIADVLDMRVDDAALFFKNFSKIKGLLRALIDVGLGYVELGQSSVTLSGGEAQRVKLAAELGKPTSGHTLYVLDEPTTGLHFADIHRLLNVLNRLVAFKHTVIVIEHNLDVIKMADWIIDMGPDGGDDGGYIVAQGTPEQIARKRGSHTGRYLKSRLNGQPPVLPRPAKRARKRAAKTA